MLWGKMDCDFSSVEQYLNVDSFAASLNSISELASVDKHVVIDNSPLPDGGAYSGDNLTTMLQVRTDFEMTYNIKTLSLFAGLACITLLLLISAFLYLCGKTRADYKSK